jgi:hypothetical protein
MIEAPQQEIARSNPRISHTSTRSLNIGIGFTKKALVGPGQK